MFSELHDFDFYPMVFLTKKETLFTVQSRGAGGCRIDEGKIYVLNVKEAELSQHFAGNGCQRDFEATGLDGGKIELNLGFEREGMYFINICEKGGNFFATLRVYALEHDMEGLYPFRGDLHMHTCRSDGHSDPLSVASEYRMNGYDFTVISDHGRYYPSLELRKSLHIGTDDRSDITEMLIVPGEEVHLPCNPVHYVNFGGKFSVNALVAPNSNTAERGDSPEVRSLEGECPEPMTEEEYIEMIRKDSENVPLELESERISFASMKWIYEQVKAGDGLGIFPHPYWLFQSMHLSQSYTEFIYKEGPFDAFEVLGGENYYQHNGFQTGFYYDMKVKGYDYPVVGSTDSHNATENNRNAMICSTIVFAKENTTRSLIEAIKSKYSIAVDTISAEYRLVGDFRLMKYASFLMENWFPVHDRACMGEGYYLRAFGDGDKAAEEILKLMKNTLPAMRKKYFAV